MIKDKKPRIGVLALMLSAYEPIFPGITNRQEDYVRATLAPLNDIADFDFSCAAKSRAEIESQTRAFNSTCDGIIIILLSYSEGQHLVRAMQNNSLPLAMALIQPDETVLDDFGELELTVNQAIHGSQDNANCLMRAGINCSYFAGSKEDGSFKRFVENFARASLTVSTLRHMKIGVIGKLDGMGDVMTDDMAFYRTIGPEFTYDSIGVVQKLFQSVSDDEVEKVISRDKEVFEIDEKLSHADHAYAIKLYLAIKQYLILNDYSGYTLHFDEMGADGRFRQLPLLAASHLMADGYGYAAEGDAVTAALMAGAFTLFGNANFSEMYMMDLKRDAILFCHAGEGNWATAAKNKKPRLIDRYFGEGGLENPPTPIFTPEPGAATVMTIAHVSGNRFRLICSHGEILDKSDLRGCDMPYFFFKPKSGTTETVKRWLEVGGGHHEVLVLGQTRERLQLLAKMLDMDFLEV